MRLKIKYFYVTVLTFLFNLPLFAGFDDGGGDIPDQPPGPGDGAPASPIDMYIPLLIIAAVLFTVWYVRRQKLRNA